jgi:tetratricopeptide (TPR) repeat protein
MSEEIQKVEVAAKRSWGIIMAWIGGISALIGFIGTIGGGFTWLKNHHRRNSQYTARMALAQTETKQKQYQDAIKTYDEILKDDPLDRAALDAQLDTAMLWVENFSILVPSGKDEGELSGPVLDEIFPVLNSGLTRVTGTRSADVQSHLGWGHFLNEKIAHREDDSVAIQDWRGALSADSANVYANAMLGNELLQSGGDLAEANQHLHAAAATGRALPFVRELQIGGLLHLEKPGARAEIMRVANQMMQRGEPLDAETRQRISSWCFDPVVTRHDELIEALGALPSDDAWKTYLWLSNDPNTSGQDVKQKFVHANLQEIAGRRDAALTEFKELKKELGSREGSLVDQVEAGIKRLTPA